MKLAPILVAAALPLCAQFEFFETGIRPVLVNHCYQCHDAKAARSGLALDSKAGMLRGRDAGNGRVLGQSRVQPRHASDSYRDSTLKMPPTGRLPDSVVEDFREWIRHGAEDPREEAATTETAKIDWDRARRHWAFQPLKPLSATIDSLIDDRLARERLVSAPTGIANPLVRLVVVRLVVVIGWFPFCLILLAPPRILFGR